MVSVVSLSQAHLTLLETCPKRFQYIFDQALAVPSSANHQQAALWGNQFHLVMQQQALGLPMAVMAQADGDITAKVNELKQQAPQLFQPAADERLRQSEHQRTLAFNGYVFTVIYDLIILTAQTGLIVDWKTYLKPPDRDRVASDWQTRLYLYVLTETSGLPPGDITMAYWFVRHQDDQGKDRPPSAYEFRYSLAQHDRTRTELLRLTDRLSTLRQTQDFPKTDHIDRCDRCPFQIRCQRRAMPTLSIDLDAIEEIEINHD